MNTLLRDYAFSFLGVPYKFGGRNRLEGLDCSQFVIELLLSQGMLPFGYDSTAQGLHDHFKVFGVDSDPCAGALSFYGTSLHNIIHVGFCLNKESMIECGGGGQATITLANAIEKNAMVRIRPVKLRTDYLCCLMLPYAPGI